MKNVLKTSVLVLSVFMMSKFAIAKEKVKKETAVVSGPYDCFEYADRVANRIAFMQELSFQEENKVFNVLFDDCMGQ